MLIRTKIPSRSRMLILFVILACVLLFAHYTANDRHLSRDKLGQNRPRYKLVIIVLTGPDNLERRNAIRNTWLSEKRKNVKHLFALGTLDVRPDQRDSLKFEKDKHEDLLLLPNLQDSYNTLTKKVLQSFAQIHEDCNYDFVLKCDDDSFVLVDKVLKELDKWQNKGTKKELYWGFFNGKGQVKRSGPWKEPDWIFCDNYLPYALGGGYVLSRNLVNFIARNVDILKLHIAEDVSVGLWLAPLANIERKHDVRFDTEYRSRGCSNEYLITHKQTVDSMDNMHQLYKATGALCVKEVRNRMSYQYDWSVPPSQCCSRQSGIP